MKNSFDYLVVGGGSAGSVLASRLTEDPDVTLCLFEAGGTGDGWPVNVPAALVLMIPSRLNNWAFETAPQKGLQGRRGYQPRGKALGGSSAINAMVYTRGHHADYDDWAALGNEGWGWNDVFPYFKRSEHNERLGNEWHGRGGPLWVSDLRTDNPFQARWLDAARECGLPVTDDFNGAEQEGVGIYQVTQKNGERWSAARAYLFPHMKTRGNLTVETGAQVRRIVFDGKRAVGVEVTRGGNVETVWAKKEVILSAGAFQSPQLLMLSGVGPKDELERHGIEVVADLPGVGENLQDHPDFVLSYKTNSLDALGVSVRGAIKTLGDIRQYRNSRTGTLTTNFAEGGAFLKTRPELDRPDVQMHFVVGPVSDHGRKVRLGHGLSCHVCLLRPKSRGSVKLRSADPLDAPLIDPAFLDHEDDLEVLVEGYKLTRRLMAAPAMARFVTEDMFASRSRSDDDIRALLRERTDTVYHPVGTCRMGNDALAVVDSQLRVRGTEGLRVVDASIMPTLVGANTNAPTIMIGEKASDLIRRISRFPSAMPETAV
ncbi:glucose-methanol-choline oxidoreductase [Burkholderia contaminans FFH2055]|uniref:GMC family oxidoreductase n=1 Tax=Burkholderia contaminans TaxID=488447 RepID=UPI00062661D0|nr:choline dehydrogenase [Burkholderia contaminans]KKL35400.1 glucose-methanol-choline oxidoreductase [Burkholderia contaminans FFH2055]MEB4639827.1 choline dehydrogenase [Burkholderia contaminans]MEB4654683.1 choline dehydrogenase [Burkholderia contaminans]MEB4659227.1 choline dehydrogenase [Burkholderia contaminans]MEB4669725.1 choline dehydrogenase [Burkholderia contaminans]